MTRPADLPLLQILVRVATAIAERDVATTTTGQQADRDARRERLAHLRAADGRRPRAA